MNDNDKIKFGEIMIGLAENFSSTIGDTGLRMRYEALKGFSIDQLQDAAMIILRTRKYTSMPTVAEFFEALEGDANDIAEIQASLVTSAISQYGSYNPPKFEDPITQDIMSNKINWGDLCASTSKDVNFKMKEFRQLYKSYSKAASGNMINAPAKIKNLLKTMTKEIE